MYRHLCDAQYRGLFMSDISFNCSRCGHSLVVVSSAAGMVVPCPICKKQITVPYGLTPNRAATATPPPMPSIQRNPKSNKRKPKVFLIIAVVFIALSATFAFSLFHLKPYLAHRKLMSELSWVINQQRGDGWWAFRWGMNRDEVKSQIRGDIRMLSDDSYLGSVPKEGYGKDEYDAFFLFDSTTKGLCRLMITLTPLPLRLNGFKIEEEFVSYHTALYGHLLEMLSKKHGKPIYGDEYIKGNTKGILHGNTWKVNDDIYIDIIETPKDISICFSPAKGENAESVLFTTMMNTFSNREKQGMLRVKEQRREYAASQTGNKTTEEELSVKILDVLKNSNWARFKWGISPELLAASLAPDIKLQKHELHSDGENVTWILSEPSVSNSEYTCNVNVGLDVYSGLTRKLVIIFPCSSHGDPLAIDVNRKDIVHNHLQLELNKMFNNEGTEGSIQWLSENVKCKSWGFGNTRVSLLKEIWSINVIYEDVRR